MDAEVVTVSIRVQPGASRTRVGGTRGDALIVAVSARAVEGAATSAAIGALADAVGVRPRRVALLHGERSREKVVTIQVEHDDRSTLEARLAELRLG